MKQRILAIAGAVALVVVAVVVRAQLAGDDDSTSGGGGGGGGRPVVACSPGLEEICRTLAEEGLVAADPLTFDLGSAGATTGTVGDTPVDAWITWDPAGEIANFDAQATTGSPVWDDPEPVGSSPLAIAGKPALREVGCADPTWACLKTAFDDGNAIGVGDPATVDGLVRAQPFVASLLGRDGLLEDLDVSLVDEVITSSRASRPAPFLTQLNLFDVRAGSYQVVVGPATGLGSRDRDVALPPAPDGGTPPAMNLVVTPRVGSSAGWVDGAFSRPAVEAAVRAAGVDPESATLAGTPDAGQLHALRERLTGP